MDDVVQVQQAVSRDAFWTADPRRPVLCLALFNSVMTAISALLKARRTLRTIRVTLTPGPAYHVRSGLWQPTPPILHVKLQALSLAVMRTRLHVDLRIDVRFLCHRLILGESLEWRSC